MNFFKSVVSAGAVLTAVGFTACGDSSSTSSEAREPVLVAPESIESLDCSVENGVKVLFPKGGESVHMGDTVLVVYGTDVKGSGFRFVFKKADNDSGLDMLEESAGPESPDGKTCYEQKVVLTDEVAEPTETAIIRVIPYEETKKGSNSGTFKVTE